ncbi:MAG: riboflavin synthase [Acidobacteria bacterium]|nr:riboflavin synthase [Acidobacteriota bacterium]
MFTGIVCETGDVVNIDHSRTGTTLVVRSSLAARLKSGDSVSVDGVCLTVTEGEPRSQRFTVVATPETLRRTNLGHLRSGSSVNLEPSATLSSFLGGHLVQGHVDATGTVASVKPEGNSYIFRIDTPAEVLQYCAMKGSITINGVSLTISGMGKSFVEVTIIPHTYDVTNFSRLKPGDEVNLEADIISKYVESHVRRILGTTVLFLLFSSSVLLGSGLVLGPHSILVYENLAGKKESRFILRLVRLSPDAFLEWESVSHQGTVHLYSRALKEGRKFSLSQLFEVGVDVESEEVTTIWLSEAMYRELTTEGASRIVFNNLPLVLQVKDETTFSLTVDKQPVEISVIRAQDDRKGNWKFQKDPNNPILVEYTSPYFKQSLKSVSTGTGSNLRWIRKVPPVK